MSEQKLIVDKRAQLNFTSTSTQPKLVSELGNRESETSSIAGLIAQLFPVCVTLLCVFQVCIAILSDFFIRFSKFWREGLAEVKQFLTPQFCKEICKRKHLRPQL